MNARAAWRKLGLVFRPDGRIPWMDSHASVPIAESLGAGLFRVYFSARDKQHISHTGFVVVDIARPSEILAISDEPVLRPGALGEFDDSGAMASWLAQDGSTRYLYYVGWNLSVTVPFRNAIGLAVSRHGHAFERFARGPILDRSMVEPHFCASCCVIPGNDVWRMWYLSCTDWELRNGKPRHRYHIKYAESRDGISWDRNGIVAIDYADAEEYAISRPSVVRDSDAWRMWYSKRGGAYRIGYAESENGKDWRRLDGQAGIDVSPAGWDSEMIEYPFVFDHEGQRYMLYNGNNYGETGFGLAILERQG
jgi:hypothetical protein